MSITMGSGTWTGLTDHAHGIAYTILVDKAPIRKQIKLLMRKKQMRFLRENINELMGAAAGEAMADTYAQADGSAGFATVSEVDSSGNTINVTRKTSDAEMGGQRAINTVTLATGNTTAAELADANLFLFPPAANLTYVEDSSGNGGGGQLGY